VPLVDQQVGSKALEPGTVLDALNREVVPVVRRLRALVNAQLTSAAVTIGDGLATVFAVENPFGTRDVVVAVYDTGTYLDVPATVERTTADLLTITFGVAPAADAVRVLIRP
jgi:hypothetical protein